MTLKAKAIVIEDEYKVREVFINLLEKFCPEIDIIAEAENIQDAHRLIIEKKPSVIFLDIEMAGGNGFDLLNKFKEIDFEIIFVTSYDHYALKAIKYSALDYLLKPVTIEELQEVVQSLMTRIEGKHYIEQYKLLQENLKKPEDEAKLVVNTHSQLEYLCVNDILFLEGASNYTTFYLKNGNKCIIPKTLKKYEEILCSENSSFIRIHKSFIVNRHQIKSIDRGDNYSITMRNGTQLQISRRKRQELIEKFNMG